MSRQLTSRYLAHLRDSGIITSKGTARWTQYRLKFRELFCKTYDAATGPREDIVWTESARVLSDIQEEEQNICHHGITELFNNALDHSNSHQIRLTIARTAVSLRIQIVDSGIGIFQKIASALQLTDPRLSLLELSKGRFTTDPTRHTGEGVFFTSRMFDRYMIRSADLLFIHRIEQDDWLTEDKRNAVAGTRITMDLLLPSRRNMTEVFQRYSSGPKDYNFAKTHVPMRLAKFGDEALISRSAAKRVLARIEKFDEVMLDFDGVKTVGQGFADEIFRVFSNEHPRTKLIGINMNAQVTMMVTRATHRRDEDAPSLFSES